VLVKVAAAVLHYIRKCVRFSLPLLEFICSRRKKNQYNLYILWIAFIVSPFRCYVNMKEILQDK